MSGTRSFAFRIFQLAFDVLIECFDELYDENTCTAIPWDELTLIALKTVEKYVSTPMNL